MRIFFSILTLFILQPMMAQIASAQDMPDNRMHMEAARDYIKARQWDFASYEYRKALALEPDNLDAQLGLAQSLSESGYTADAIAHLQQSRERTPHPRLDLEQAKLNARIGETNQAVTLYLGILKDRPFYIPAIKDLLDLRDQLPAHRRQELNMLLSQRAAEAEAKGAKAFTAGDFKLAAPYYEIASACSNRDDLHNKYALALLFNGEGDESSREFSSLNLTHQRWELHANAALALLSQDKTYAARQELEKAIQMVRKPADQAKLYNLLGYVHEAAGRVADARYAYAHALELDPGLNKARTNLAYIYLQDYRYEKAESLYRETLAREPNRAETWNQLGFVYELQQEPRKARTAYLKAIELNPGLKEAYRNLATLYEKLGKKNQADQTLQKMMALQYARLEGKRPEAHGAVPDSTMSAHPLFQYVDVFLAGP